jgi:hypothetical protein
MRALLAVAAVALISSAASAEFIGPVFSVIATNGVQTDSFSVPVEALTFDPETERWSWALAEPVDLGDGLATLNDGRTSLLGDPQISFGFLVTTGALPVHFTICSTTIVFAPINAQATASAQIGATDILGDGVIVTGGYAGATKGYQATYNGGTVFANLVNNFVGGPFSSPVSSEGNPPGGGFVGIGVASSMQACYDFTVSGSDQASGTSTYVIIPEPSSLALIGLGLLAGLRRR